MDFRTDLALESISSDELSESIHISTRGQAFSITEIVIDDDSCLSTIGKGRGRYITLEGSSLSRFSDDYSLMAQELAQELSRLIPDGDALVVGLGNNDITPDAIGPQTAAKVLATRHLSYETESDEEQFFTTLRSVSTFSFGVMGQTGIESAEIVRAVASEIRPACIIAVDALACGDISRLGTTIQITDTGISPGSGVSNQRRELSQKLYGVPVIAVGIPTVVDMHTIVRSLTGKKINKELPNIMVTPRDIDRLTERASQLLAYGINLALQPTLSFEDVRGLF
ncbi:GPR endopeptidase [Ruminococcus flavefaciens]|uniref:GPR endopeptidase n=1 Tax=Ruminococcus flavefaciens TaxID=1265 RepID=UPI0026EA2BFD|nr:GPR endopeptidase [Ruminococcus flavefaciens]MDD7515140.1 GPR endopeptidase [Ruminococcus flavefaciens]MDY5691565.1 GPR endopeptidase [Ruminococcus flavefaciens]